MDAPEESPHPEIDAPGHDAIVTFAVFFEGGLAPFSLLLGWWFAHPPLRHFDWNFQAVMLGAAAAAAPAACFLAMLRWPIGPLVRIKRFCEDEFVPLLGNSSWADLVLIAISAGVGEEMLFRGVFQTSIASATNETWGVILSSLLFGALHPISIPYSIVSFSMGVYLALIFLSTGNLLAAIVCHGVYDFVLMAYLLRPGDPNRPIRNPIDAIDADRHIDEHDAP
ncbi:CPBP family intramembrane glutamic endopeptidase [Planctomyces sp. SH-PL62]|uniref:CPBP family intramembrane glutamic endopeptidase n=1 Tax=Planctomyces sp. SH-PL62 TaxID=1636152 RepID=UPI0018D403D9|nr:CPBP family intramembrane glutamic endopeptidase [Planctomyces sp. SH-PL62]